MVYFRELFLGEQKMVSSDGPLVTIRIPTYNRANNFLRNALGSVPNQTYMKLEIIVLDNRSTDQTESLVRHFPTHAYDIPIIIMSKFSKRPPCPLIFKGFSGKFCVNRTKQFTLQLISAIINCMRDLFSLGFLTIFFITHVFVMAMELPLVASDISGIVELVDNGWERQRKK